MPYIGNSHIAGDHTNNFKVLDDISSFTATFDGSASSVVDTTNNTIRVVEHRFIQGQRVTYTNGSGGNIGGLTTGTAYFVIFDSASTIKLATSASNAVSSIAINLSAVGTGSSHTLNAAFDGTNKKFKITYDGGTSARLNNATQLNVAINNVLQKPNNDAGSFSDGFAILDNHKIVFQTAPVSGDIFWGSIIANTLTTFDISDHKIDTFTGDGSTTEFTLSHTPANNESLMVTINGVLQHPSNASTARAYTLIASIIQFTAAPGVGDEIQVRHIGFAGATTSDVSGFYGRTGNVVLTSNDHITTGDITARNFKATGISTFSGAVSTGAITATTGTFSGNVSIGGTLTYEDVTNIDSVGIITAQKDVHVGAGLSVVGVSTFSGNVHLPDNVELNLGTNNDLEIFHNDDDAYIRNNKGALIIRNNGQTGDADASQIYIQATPSENSIQCSPNGGVILYHDNDPKMTTNAAGVHLYKDLDVDGHTNLDNVSIAGVSTFTKVGATAVFNSGAANDGRLEFQYNNSRVGLLAYHSNRLEIQTDSSKDFTIRTNGANERLRITSGGDVIIGSGGAWSYPKALNVQGSSGSILSLYNGDTTTYAADTTTGIEFKLLTGNTGTTSGSCEIRAFKENGTNGNSARALSFYTGVNGGSPTERLRILSTGQISAGGGGTAWGNALLSLITPSGRSTAFSASDGDTWHDMVIKNTSAATNNAVGLAFQITGNAYHKNAGTGICAVKNGTNSDYGADLVFVTRPQSAVAEERLRITSGGQVLIGTTDAGHSSADDLTINNSGSGGITIRTGTTSNGAIFFADGTSGDARFDGFVQYNHGSSPYLMFGTAGDERVRITNGGNLKLPDNAKIELGGGQAGSGDLEIFFDGTHSKIDHKPTSGSLFLAGDSLVLSNSGMSQYYIQAAENGAVSLNYSGSTKLSTSNTGISITGIPVATQSTGNIGLELHATGSGRGSQTKYHNDHGVQYVGTAGDTTGNLLIWQESNANIFFATNNTQRLRIDNTGRLIAGGTSAGTYHQDGDEFNIYSTGNTGMSIFSGTSSLGSLFFADDNNDVHGQRRGAIQYNHNGNYLALWTNAGEKLRIASDGSLTSTANNNGQIIHTFKNDNTTAGSSAQTVEHWFRFNRTGGGMNHPAAKIVAGKEREWIGGATNQDGYLAFYTTLNENGGAERLRITSTGKVSLGSAPMTTPPSWLHVKGNTYQTLRLENYDGGGNGPYIELYNNSASPADDDYTGIISFKNNNDANPAEEITYSQIRSQSTDVTDGQEDGVLTFHTRNNGTFGERLRIAETATLSIGGLVPNISAYHGLEISNAATTELRLKNTNGGSGQADGFAIQKWSNGNSYVYDYDPNNIVFGVSNSSKMKLYKEGRLSLSPSGSPDSGNSGYALSIVQAGNYVYSGSATGNYPGIHIRSTSTGGGNGVAIYTPDSNWGLYSNAGNKTGLALSPNTSSAASANTKLFIREDGHTSLGSRMYEELSDSIKCKVMLSVTGGGLALSGYNLQNATGEDPRHIKNWYSVAESTGATYHHLVTSLWGGGSPHGNTSHIMGGFTIKGYSYGGTYSGISNNTGVSNEDIFFHNWSGSVNHGYKRHYHGSGFDPGNAAYVNSSGYVTLRLKAGRYTCYYIDLYQFQVYAVRDIYVTSHTMDGNTTI